MGKLLAALKRMPKRTSAFVAVIAAAIIVPATLFAWGPSRVTFTEEHPASYVTFNSITNNSFYGDERNFVTVKDASNTNDGGWSDNVTVQPGKEYVVRMYVHNNAASNLNLVAENTRASASVPTTTGKSVPISGYVSADNANPKQVWDDVQLNSDQNFNLAYVPGSASFHNNSVGKAVDGAKLSDSIVTSAGALLGYDKLDGKIPGCYQYSGYVYFKVKPQFAPTDKFDVVKQVRKSGDKTWQKSVDVKPGDNIDYLLTYKNSGQVRENNVLVQDTLPTGVSYVDGSTTLTNSTNPSGLKVSDNVTKPVGINVGDYEAGGGAYVKFSAKVGANDTLPVCGPNKLTNKVRITANGGYKEDTADVTVPKECQPEVKYTCDALTVTKIDRTNFKFDTKYTVENATYKSTTYVIRDDKGTEITRTTNPNYTQDKVGKYTVEAIVTVTVNGQDKTVTSENCKKPFEVTEIPSTPVYTCDALTATKISRLDYSFTGKATATGGATITSYTFDFGDGTAAQTVTNPNDVKHSYAKDGTYTAKLSVLVKVNDENKTVTDATKCVAKVTISPEECKPGIPVGDERCTEKPECKPGIPVGDSRCEEKPECKPGIPMGSADCEEKCAVKGKENLPKDSKDCVETPTTPETPTELPHTGMGDGLVALIGAGALIASIGYYIASRRALN